MKKRKDSIDNVIHRINVSAHKHNLGGGAVSLVTIGIGMPFQFQRGYRIQKLLDARQALRRACDGATLEERANAIEIVKEGLKKAEIVDKEGNAGIKRLGKDKYAHLLAQTLQTVKEAKGECVDKNGNLTNNAKNVLIDSIAKSLNQNTKKETTFKNITDTIFGRKDHVHVKKPAYMVKNELKGLLNPSSYREKVSLSRSSSVSLDI